MAASIWGFWRDSGGSFLPSLTLHGGPGSLPLGKGIPGQGLTTGLVGAAAVWAPHLHQSSAHATLYLGTAEALTHCEGGEAGDTSAADTWSRNPQNATLAKERAPPWVPPCPQTPSRARVLGRSLGSWSLSIELLVEDIVPL